MDGRSVSGRGEWSQGAARSGRGAAQQVERGNTKPLSEALDVPQRQLPLSALNTLDDCRRIPVNSATA